LRNCYCNNERERGKVWWGREISLERKSSGREEFCHGAAEGTEKSGRIEEMWLRTLDICNLRPASEGGPYEEKRREEKRREEKRREEKRKAGPSRLGMTDCRVGG
jgi:hypothetical protein